MLDEKALRTLGSSGVIRLGQGAVQVIFGTQSERLSDEIKQILAAPSRTQRAGGAERPLNT
jgi:PTS system N-acetylglucosamine-specific IIC component